MEEGMREKTCEQTKKERVVKWIERNKRRKRTILHREK